MNKEVKRLSRKEVKKEFLLNLINSLKQGGSPASISKDLKISKQKLQYYIRQLKEQGIIKKLGYGVWEVKEVKSLTKDTLEQEVRGHAFIWKIKLPKIRNWDKRLEILQKLKIPYKLVGIKGTPRIILQGRKIWLGNKHLVIYEIKSFIAENSIRSRKFAIQGLLDLIEALENKLKVSFKIKGKYNFAVRRSHYALMKNILAIQCNKDKERIYVFDKGGLWFCIDNSYNLDEAETMGQRAMGNNLGVQAYFNSHKETGFKVTPDFILKNFGGLHNLVKGVTQNQMIFAENMKSHIKAIQDIGKGTKKNNEIMEEIKEILKEFKK